MPTEMRFVSRGFACPRCGASIFAQIYPPPGWDLKLFCCWLSRREFLKAAGLDHEYGGAYAD